MTFYPHFVLIFLSLLLLGCTEPIENTTHHQYSGYAKIFHYILGHWGHSKPGIYPCGDIHCEWVISDNIKHLRDNVLYLTDREKDRSSLVSLSLYNIHSLWEKRRELKPPICELPTNFTMYETEESAIRYYYLFDPAKPYFDGYSSTSPEASVQRVYAEAFLNRTEFLPLRNFSSLIKGGSYVASDCHRRDSANANRDHFIQLLRNEGFRIDGLGRCMHTPTGPEGIALSRSRDTRYDLHLKRDTISHFMFYFAFENSLEPGYVTEKPFDALIAGIVPVYLGDANHLRDLLPHPKAAIYLADYEGNMTALAAYLTYLTEHEEAYEQHRSAWRSQSSYLPTKEHAKALLSNSWQCRVCQWAVHQATQFPTAHRTPLCIANHYGGGGDGSNGQGESAKVKLPAEWEHKAVRSKKQRQVYYVEHGILHAIPDFDTFVAMKLDVGQIQAIEQAQLDTLIIGDPVPRRVASG